MNWILLFLAWLTALIGTLGSLFFSEVMGYPPCVLCWYQRILMYPLVFILPAGIFPLDKKAVKYTLPLALIGLGTSIYHNLLYYKILPESAAPCKLGISCTTVHIQWLGFITIPFLSFMAFLTIVALLIIFARKDFNEK